MELNRSPESPPPDDDFRGRRDLVPDFSSAQARPLPLPGRRWCWPTLSAVSSLCSLCCCFAEMAVARPVSGSFESYARTAFALGAALSPAGPTGWPSWIGPASEAIAAGTFLNLWFPGVPVWLFCPVIASSLTAINMVGVHFSVRWSSG